MIEVDVNPGICGLKTKITIITKDMETVDVLINTECESVKKMESELKEIDCMEECLSRFSSSRVYKAAEKYCEHVSCPVPSAIIKGIEVACAFALPRDVKIVIKK